MALILLQSKENALFCGMSYRSHIVQFIVEICTITAKCRATVPNAVRQRLDWAMVAVSRSMLRGTA